MAGPFGRISFSEANPVMEGYAAAQKLQSQDLQNIMSGLLNQNQQVANQYQPQTMEQQLQGMKLTNALSKINLDYAPQMSEANLSNIKAQTGLYGAQSTNALASAENARATAANTRFSTDNPGLNMTGPAGQIAMLTYMKNNPNRFRNVMGGGAPNNPNIPQNQAAAQNPTMSRIGIDTPLMPGQMAPPQQGGVMQNIGGQVPQPEQPQDLMGLLEKSIYSELNRKNSVADLTKLKAENYGYDRLTADQKRQWVAKAAGMGIGENESRNFFNSGGSIDELADQLGYDSNDLPEAIYAPTNTDITRAHFRQQAVAEIKAIQPILTKALAPYSRRVMDYSPEQVVEAISGDNPEAQAKFLAAKGLQPELSALRIKAMGGQVGIEAIREVQNASMGRLNSYQGLVSPEVYEMAQHYMDEWIGKGSGIANSMAFNTEKAQNKEIGQKGNQEDPLGIR